MDYSNDKTFYNYVALWRAIVKKEGQRDALYMCGVPTSKEGRAKTSRRRPVKRTNVKTGQVDIYNHLGEASTAMGLKGNGVWDYVRTGKEYKGYKFEYLEDDNE